MAMCDCCEAAPSAIEYEELNFCADCLVILPYALADLGHAIARFVRRATVAELRNDVLGAAHNWKAARGFELEDQERKARHWGELLAALDTLARLAGGGA